MKDKVLFSISIEQLLQHKIGASMGTNIIATAQLTEYIDLFNSPLRMDALLFCVCLKGSVDITINLTRWNVKQNTYLISLPENIIGVNSVSDDFEGYVILFSMAYLRKISINLKDVLPYYMYVRSHPCFNVGSLNVKKMTQFYNLIYSSLKDENSSRKGEIIKGLVTSILFKISEDLDEFGLKTIATAKTKSKEYYFLKFMDLLLLNFREQHHVGFYADKLALTPKYLSALIKDTSGLSVPQWINNYVIVEAKTLLKSSDMNINQIADYLNFPTSSFFSKYFRHHTGIAPRDYRINGL